MADSERSRDLVHFQNIPWCSALLSSPGFKPTETFSRTVKAYGEDSLFGQTLKSDNTITHMHTMYQPAETRAPPLIVEVRTLITLGAGMNGGPNALHGGIITTLMDDTMGALMKLNREAEELPSTAFAVTAKMDVRFRKLVATPGTYCVGARCTKKEGRKVRIQGWVRDREGDVCATSESVWILVTRSEAQMKL